MFGMIRDWLRRRAIARLQKDLAVLTAEKAEMDRIERQTQRIYPMQRLEMSNRIAKVMHMINRLTLEDIANDARKPW